MDRIYCPKCRFIVYDPYRSQMTLTTCVVHTPHFDTNGITPHIASCISCLTYLENLSDQKCGKCHEMTDHYSLTVIPKGYPLANPRHSKQELFLLGLITIGVQLLSYEIGKMYIPNNVDGPNPTGNLEAHLGFVDLVSTSLAILLISLTTMPFAPKPQREESFAIPAPFYSQGISIATGLLESLPYAMAMHLTINQIDETSPIELSEAIIYLQALLAAHFAIEKHRK